MVSSLPPSSSATPRSIRPRPRSEPAVKFRWLGVGLAVTAVSALGVVALRRRQSAQDLPPEQQPPSQLPPAEPESSVPKLASADVVQALDGWLRALGGDKLGQQGVKPPDPATGP